MAETRIKVANGIAIFIPYGQMVLESESKRQTSLVPANGCHQNIFRKLIAVWSFWFRWQAGTFGQSARGLAHSMTLARMLGSLLNTKICGRRRPRRRSQTAATENLCLVWIFLVPHICSRIRKCDIL